MKKLENSELGVDEKATYRGDNQGIGEWLLLNQRYPEDENILGVCTVAMQIDDVGCIVQTIVSSVKQCSVSQCFIPGVRIEGCTDRPVGFGNEEHDAAAKVISRRLVRI